MVSVKQHSSLVNKKNVPYDINKIRGDFPILQQEFYGQKLCFLDSAASSQKPSMVIDAITKCYQDEYANIHRGVYKLSAIATKNFDESRIKVKKFLNAKNTHEIIFVRGGTEAINLVAYSYGRYFLKAGDEIIISYLEHHANIVPWQVLRDQMGIKIKIAPINDRGEIILEEYKKLFSSNTKFVSLTHIANSIGTINPVKEMIKIAHENGSLALIDGCQAVPHLKIDVQDLNADFYVFSGHKLYGPTGIGVLYGKAELLNKMPPYQTGGDMILSVGFDKTIYNDLPYKFEAGTPAIAEATALGVAIDYVESVGLDNIKEHERQLFNYAMDSLQGFKEIKIYSNAKDNAAIITFNFANVHAHDVGTILDQNAICVRTGNHCAQPLTEFLGASATVRASFGMYNNEGDIDSLILGLKKVREIFA